MIRKTNRQNQKRLVVNTKTTLLLMICLVFFLAACGNNKSFDSNAWLQGDTRARGRMSDDMVKRKILIGQTVDEAQRLLGQPDKAYPTALSYKIDLGWLFKDPKSYGLLVYFDEKRIVSEVKIVD